MNCGGGWKGSEAGCERVVRRTAAQREASHTVLVSKLRDAGVS